MMHIVRAGVASALLAVVGCASTSATTAQQDYTYEMGRKCETPTTKLERVAPDGKYWIQARGDAGLASTEYPRFFACMKEQFQAQPFLEWARARGRQVAQSSQVTPTGSAVGSSLGPVAVPVWKVGDEWQFAYKSPTDSGTYVWSVSRVESLDGVGHYVIRTGSREILYRVSDLAPSLERVDGVVVMRETPPRTAYLWPLEVGKTWEQSNRQERPVDRTTLDRNSVWTVEAEETTTVLAGTFQTVRIVWRNKNTGALLYEMWYAPEVKQLVKIREVLSNGQRERELMSFKLK